MRKRVASTFSGKFFLSCHDPRVYWAMRNEMRWQEDARTFSFSSLFLVPFYFASGHMSQPHFLWLNFIHRLLFSWHFYFCSHFLRRSKQQSLNSSTQFLKMSGTGIFVVEQKKLVFSALETTRVNSPFGIRDGRKKQIQLSWPSKEIPLQTKGLIF